MVIEKGTTECQTCALGRNVTIVRTHNLASSRTLREVNLWTCLKERFQIEFLTCMDGRLFL